MATWSILGVGAIGSLWACNLHRAGHKVELLFRNPALLKTYRTRGGLTLVTRGQQETFRLDAGVAGEAGEPVQLLLVATKAHQTLDALRQAGARLAPHTRVLLLQNGMGVAAGIREQFALCELYCGVTTDGAYCTEPFTVVHAGSGITHVGAFRHDGDPQTLMRQLPGDLLHIEPCADIEPRQWRKLAINCAINGLTVIYQCRNGELLQHEEARQRMVRLCDEIQALATALGYGASVQDLQQETLAVLRATAANYNSMYQDIERRRGTEIDYLNGYLLQQAQRLGIPCPENRMLYEEVKRREEGFT